MVSLPGGRCKASLVDWTVVVSVSRWKARLQQAQACKCVCVSVVDWLIMHARVEVHTAALLLAT